MEKALAEYLRHLSLEKNASAYTVKSYREDLGQALEFFREKAGIKPAQPSQITTRHVRGYLAWLHEQQYSKATIARRIAAVRSWFRFLCRQGVVEGNPADGLRGPRQNKKLPHFLSEAELSRLIEKPSADTPLGLRDRAILETLYSSGVRVGELTGLNVEDVDVDSGLAVVRGKGKRERLALLGKQALAALKRWLPWREEYSKKRNRSSTAVFLNKNGGRLTSRRVGRQFAK